MARNYIRDGFNPRGAEYGATARAADAAQHNAEAANDLLDLQLAPSPQERDLVSARIRARRAETARQRAWWRRLDLIAAAIVIAFLVWCFVPDAVQIPGTPLFWSPPWRGAPASAVTNDTPAHALTAPRHAQTHARRAQAPAIDGCTVTDNAGAPVALNSIVLDGFTARQIADDCRERIARGDTSETDAL